MIKTRIGSRLQMAIAFGILVALPAGLGSCGSGSSAPAGSSGNGSPEPGPGALATDGISPVHTTWDDMVQSEQSSPGGGLDLTPMPYMPGPTSPLDAVGVPGQSATGGVSPSTKIGGGGGLAPLVAAAQGFQALTSGGSNGEPPDTNGAVGPRHLMTMLNTQVRIQDKLGNVLSTVNESTFWAPVTPLTLSDPKVLFDKLSGRWISTIDINPHPAVELMAAAGFAISDTDDPMGGWTFYRFDADAADPLARSFLLDFPGLGVNELWIVITNRSFPTGGGGAIGPRMMVIDKSTALAGGLLTVTDFWPGFDNTGSGVAFTLKPAVHLDLSTPGIMWMMDAFPRTIAGDDALRWSFLSGTAAAPVWSPHPLVGGGSGIYTWNLTNEYGNQPNAPQLGSAALVATNGDKPGEIWTEPVVRNGHFWVTFMGGLPAAAPDRTAIWWWDFPGMSTALVPISPNNQRIDPGAGVHFTFPSIGVNKDDAAVIGFTRVDATRFPECVAISREAADPPGTTTPITVFRTGLGPYTGGRWGDYSATTVDPTDDTTIWTIQEYGNVAGPGADWATWWSRWSPFPPMMMTSTLTASTNTMGGTAMTALDCSNPPMPPMVNAECVGGMGAALSVNFNATLPSGAPFRVELAIDADTTDMTPPVVMQTQNAAGMSPGPSMLMGTFSFNLPVQTMPYLVEVRATDSSGDADVCQILVTVQDTTGPTIMGCPMDITVECMGPGGTVVNYTAPTATDVCEGAVAVTCMPPSGSMFPLGMTMVTCTAMDSKGNMAAMPCTFMVTVEDTMPPVVTASAGRTMLFLPRGGMYDSLLTYSVMDVCDPMPTKQVTVYSNIADTLVAPYTPDVILNMAQLQVRADTDLSLAGPPGRVYLIVVTGTDHAMPMPNAASACTWVIVPKTATVGDILGARNLALAAQAACPNPGPGPAPAQTPMTELATTALP